MKSKLPVIVIGLLCQLTLSCKKVLDEHGHFPPVTPGHPLRMAIVSDIHYIDPSLFDSNGAAGTAFQDYLNKDPKLLQYSALVFRKVMSQLLLARPDILLVPGDITKDGEKIDHVTMAGFFNRLRQHGIAVYVMPGNHDINNAKAKKYVGNNDYPVAMTSKSDFENIYASFGYRAAIARDTASLSYVVQLQPGLRLISIDASKYEDYGPDGDVAEGRIKPATLTWVLAQLALAKKQKTRIFAMMHHNLIEHYTGQSQVDPGYVVDNWQPIADTLIRAGLRVIFTGHYHAQDISSYAYNGNTVFDIETGSLVTPPIPYRMVTVSDDRLDITSTRITSIDADFPDGESYEAYSNQFLSGHLDGYFYALLTGVYGAPPSLATFAAPLFRNGIMAHFAGDEKLPPDQQALIAQLAGLSPQLAGIVTTLWTDTGIRDNNTSVVVE
ncbi:MAG: metallophosphoesterase [Bacteroidetes bacterium]|nr:metallophosphoesterase [Bacteroidota bacterium]